jgi:hypothetical protein
MGHPPGTVRIDSRGLRFGLLGLRIRGCGIWLLLGWLLLGLGQHKIEAVRRAARS